MNEHPTREEDFDLYALGVLEGEEREAIESHIARCADCARKLAEARGRIALVALAAPTVEPSPGVKERLLRQVHATAEGGSPHAAKTEPERRERFFRRWWAAALVPAAVALALATIFLWNENMRLNRQLAELERALEEHQAQLTEAREMADLMGAKDTKVILLAQQAGAPQGHAMVFYNAQQGMLMYEGALAPSPADKCYQLWLVPMEGNPINAGAFNPKPGATDHWMAKVPASVAAKMFAVTIEPMGGMPHPTGPMVLAGPVS